jgi:hypothetical protein
MKNRNTISYEYHGNLTKLMNEVAKSDRRIISVEVTFNDGSKLNHVPMERK